MTTVDSVFVDGEGRWTRLETKAPQGTITTVREGDSARRTFNEKTDIIQVKPGSVLFSNYGPALMSGMIREYDKAKGGKQPLSVIVLPGAVLDGSLELKPAFDIVIEQAMAPMRDGVRLASTVWRPKGDGPFPVILIRTPYKKEMLELNAKFYARRGYAVAVQDCRGRFGRKARGSRSCTSARTATTRSSGWRSSPGRTAGSA